MIYCPFSCYSQIVKAGTILLVGSITSHRDSSIFKVTKFNNINIRELQVTSKYSVKVLFTLAIVFSWLIPANTAEAVPAFARQMSVPCAGCHFQYIPKLNSFGREFKLGGFTQTAQELIEDMKFSLPPVLNASFVAKLSYDKRELTTSNSPKVGKERGETEIPAVGVIFLGGRINENMGGLVEFKAGAESFKFVYSKDFGAFQGGLSAFTTEEMGPAHGMEGWNTGLQRHVQSGVNILQTSAQSIITMAEDGKASGVTFFGSADMFFVAFGMWAPFHGGFEDAGLNLSTYYRVALTPRIGEWDAMIGIAGASGSTKCVDCGVGGTTETDYKTNVTSINAQIQGDVSGMSLGVYADIVLDTGGDNENIYNMAATIGGTNMRNEKNTAWALQADLGVTMALGVHAGYKSHSFESRNAATDAKVADRDVTATTLGLWYKIKQNVLFAVDYTTYGSDKLIMTDATTMEEVDNDLMAVIKMGF